VGLLCFACTILLRSLVCLPGILDTLVRLLPGCMRLSDGVALPLDVVVGTANLGVVLDCGA